MAGSCVEAPEPSGGGLHGSAPGQSSVALLGTLRAEERRRRTAAGGLTALDDLGTVITPAITASASERPRRGGVTMVPMFAAQVPAPAAPARAFLGGLRRRAMTRANSATLVPTWRYISPFGLAP
jgi:hypothetical protein